MKLLTRIAVGFLTVGFTVSVSFAQTTTSIYQPEGVNMPGEWNEWKNGNDSEVMGNFRMIYRSIGGGQYVSRLNIRATGGDAVGGTYKMLFTSGSSTELYKNKWANTTLELNSTANLRYNTGSDNNVTVENGFYYTFIFDDKGYADTRVAMMRTSGIPVQIDSILGIPTQSVTSGEAVPISVKLNSPKSIEEKIYLRYTIDGWKTSESVEVTGFSGETTAIATIPGQADGTTLEFYALSTTVPAENWGNLADHFTINLNNNGGSNYVVSFGTIATLTYPVHNSTGVSPRDTLRWTTIPSANAYRIQLKEESNTTSDVNLVDSVVTGTKLGIPKGLLDFKKTYIWRVKDTLNTAQWSFQSRFTTRGTIEFANTETGTASISQGDSVLIEGKVYIENVTSESGKAPDLYAWIGVSETNTDPTSWPASAWTSAPYSRQALNDDVFGNYIGSDLEFGTYYYAFKFAYADDDTVYGGYNSTSNGGFWNKDTNVNGVLTVSKLPVLYSPEQEKALVGINPTFRWSNLGDGIRYDFQLTTQSDPSFANPIISVTGLTEAQFSPDGNLAFATAYMWRVRITAEVPQPYSAPFSFKTIGIMGFYNLQYIETDTLVVGSSTNAYAQVYINGYTTLSIPAEGIQVSIGIHSEDTDPSTWELSDWFLAELNESSLALNNDEYVLTFGDTLKVGTYYLAARFVYGDSTFYGGFSETGGGKWDGETNTNKILEVITETSVDEFISEVPSEMILNQNYPNPFNPSTQIQFSLPESGHVRLAVFDVMGREVAVVSDATYAAGTHTVTFNKAVSMSSGLYIYQLRVGNQLLQKTMLLLK